jgi:preprotein translocase subunit SecE
MEALRENAVIEKPREWIANAREGWHNVLAEMQKVTWPGRNEVVGTTVVVLVATVVFAVYLWGCDLVFFKLIDLLFHNFGAAT